MRLQKYMSQAGVCSRRKAEEYITRGLVLVNGEKAVIGQSVDPEKDEIIINDKVVEERSELVYYKLNKPRDIISTCKQDGESSILDVVDIPERVFPIGRLDKETTGLILLTNDGRLSNYLMHPRYEHEKEYAVEVYGRIEDAELDESQEEFEVPLETYEAKPKEIISKQFEQEGNLIVEKEKIVEMEIIEEKQQPMPKKEIDKENNHCFRTIKRPNQSSLP